MTKFKVGDKVRNKETGDIDTVELLPGMPEYDQHSYGCAAEGFVLESNRWKFQDEWELVEDRPQFTPPFYVDCPTPEIWERVEKKLFEMGYGWHGDGKYHLDKWHCYGTESAISTDKNRELGYSPVSFYHNEGWGKLVPHQTFLGEAEQEGCKTTSQHDGIDIFTQQAAEALARQFDSLMFTHAIKNSIKERLMSSLREIPAKIKRMLNVNYRAFYALEWVDEELNLTSTGKQELLSLLLDKHEKDLGEIAIKKVREIKKKNKQEDEE